MVIITTVLCAGGNLKVLWKLCQWSFLAITMTLKGRYLITLISMKERRLRLLILKDTHSEQWITNSLLDSKSPNPDCYNDRVIKTLCENKRGSDSVWKKKGLVPKVFACVNHSNSFLCEKWKWWPSFCSQILVTKFPEKSMWK